MKKILLSGLCLAAFNCAAQPAIEAVVQFSNASTYSNLAVLNNMLLMQGTSNDEGTELWISDGTAAGTSLLADLVSGSSSANPRFFKNALGKVLFVAYAPGFVNSMFITDGTASGTVALCALPFSPDVLTSIPKGKEIGGKFYFTNGSDTAGDELWVTDGTLAGTQMVKDINPGTPPSTPANFAVIGSALYFTANDGVSGKELWKSDGTASGTVLVKDIVPGASDAEISELAVLNNQLYFGAGTDNELWQSDGTNAGTNLLKNIGPSYSSGPVGFKEFNGKLYFSAEGPQVNIELYETDGTAAGTILTKDIKTGTGSGLPANFYPVNDKLYMTASTDANGRELMVYSPGSNEVSLVKDVANGTGSGVSALLYPDNGAGIGPVKIAHAGNMVVFAASESGFSETEIWVTDGMRSGSNKIMFNGATNIQASQYNLTAFNNSVYFYSDYMGSNKMGLYKLTNFAVGIGEEATTENGFLVYPNPARNAITINSKAAGKTGTVTISSLLGQKVFEGDINQEKQINVSHLSPGVYLVNVNHNNQINTTRLIIE